MGDVLESFPPPAARDGKYPWTVWTDGRVHRLWQGEDFDCAVRDFQTLCHKTKNRVGGTVTTRRVCDAAGREGIVVQFEGAR